MINHDVINKTKFQGLFEKIADALRRTPTDYPFTKNTPSGSVTPQSATISQSVTLFFGFFFIFPKCHSFFGFLF